MAKYCFAFNDPAIYREAIYTLMDQEYDADWYFDQLQTASVKLFDTAKLKHVYELQRVNINPFYWVKGFVGLLFKEYDVYLLRGATRHLSLFFFLFLKRLFFKKKRVYLWTHGFYGKESWVEKTFWKKPLFKLADGNFCYGNYARNIMINEGFNPKNLYVIYNSLNYSKQIELRYSLGESLIFKRHFNNDYPVIIMIGRLNLRKKLDTLISAIKELKDRGKLYNLALIGAGEDKSNLEKMCSELDIQDQVWFYGACYDERLNAELLYNADLCVVPGDIGLTAIHSMTFGCPCISHDFLPTQGPEFEAIVKDKTGLLFDHNNKTGLTDAIEAWFDHHQRDRTIIRSNCYNEIELRWNPNVQLKVLKLHMLGADEGRTNEYDD